MFVQKDLAASIITDCHFGAAAMKTCRVSTRLSCFLYSLNLFEICVYMYMSLSIFIYICTCFTYFLSLDLVYILIYLDIQTERSIFGLLLGQEVRRDATAFTKIFG